MNATSVKSVSAVQFKRYMKFRGMHVYSCKQYLNSMSILIKKEDVDSFLLFLADHDIVTRTGKNVTRHNMAPVGKDKAAFYSLYAVNYES